MQCYYWREKLTKKEQYIYDKLVDSFYKYENQISCGGFSPNKLNKIYIAITNDHPELYYLPPKVQVTRTISILGVKTELIIHNLFDRLQIDRHDSVLEKIKIEFSNRIRFCKNDFEREKVVCDFIIENTTYKIDNILNQNAATVLVDRIGQCSGIAKAAKLLLNWCGINNIIVIGSAKDTGTGQIGPHAWNIVQINNQSYHLDVTFMLGANNRKIKPYDLCYFNCTDSEMSKTHQWDKANVPSCNCSYANVNSINPVAPTISIDAETVVNTSYKLCNSLEKKLLQGKRVLSFESRIAVTSNELMAVVQNCCQKVIDKLAMRVTMSITIQGSLVQIRW